MILVTGATGRIGSQVVRALRQIDIDVVALVRKGSEYFWLNDTGCRFHFGDLRDPVSLRRACKDAQYIVVCSGLPRETRGNTHHATTIEGHQQLFGYSENAQRIVLLSCIGAGPEATGIGFRARWEAEEHLRNSGREFAILRPGLHEFFFLDMAWQAVDRGETRLAGPATNTVRPVSTVDLARMAAASLDLPHLKNRTLDVSGPQALTLLEAYGLACREVGVEPRTRPMPRRALRMASRLGGPFRPLAYQLDELTTWHSVDQDAPAEPLRETFGFDPSPIEIAIERAASEMRIMRDPEARESKM
ncbi:MAG: NAD(P)H-binding protein, partial [Myxococcota bacterium]|nr:NAD(P)H-binding protein [Myxococcota bacterium]